MRRVASGGWHLRSTHDDARSCWWQATSPEWGSNASTGNLSPRPTDASRNICVHSTCTDGSGTMTTTLADKLAGLPAERRAAIDQRAAELHDEELSLRELRKAFALTQTDLAARLKIKQASVARMEQRSDLLLSTLRSYVEAMGGRLDLIAHLPGHPPIRLREIGDLATPVEE